MNTCLGVILAAGKGDRWGGKKQWQSLWGSPVCAWTLNHLDNIEDISHLALVVDDGDADDPAIRGLVKGLKTPCTICLGGPTRQDSLREGLLAVPDTDQRDFGHVLIMDAVRPLTSEADIREVLAVAFDEGCAVAVHTIHDTLHRIDDMGRIDKQLDRNDYVRASTPQVFPRPELEAALALATSKERTFSDEAALMLWYGMRAPTVPVHPAGMKLTTSQDWDLVRRLSGPVMPMGVRIGEGFDIHRLDPRGKPLRLAGVDAGIDDGVLAHSDGDVLAHGVMDALLGAAGLGDIGRLFPDYDPAFEDADSMDLLSEVLARVTDAGLQPFSIDATVMGDRPMIAPLASACGEALAKALDIPADRINIKGTRSEGLGLLAGGQGIAVRVIAVLQPL